MTGLRFAAKLAVGKFDEAMVDVYRPIATAGTAAIREVADDAKARGRASIAAAGFSKKWQNALRGDAYPKRKSAASAEAAAVIYSKISYSDVFESGAEITGKPYLWTPFPGAPKKIGRNRFTPQNFRAQIGPMFSLKTKSRRPVLAAPMSVSKAAARRGAPYKITLAGLRRGASGQGITRAVPVFLGQSRVTLRKRFDVVGGVEDAAARLPMLYLKNLKVD